MKINPVYFRWLEAIAVVLNLLFTFYYLRSNPWCYVFGISGPAIFIVLCYIRKLYADVFLQMFYVLFAVYGWLTWGGEWRTLHWNLGQNLPYLLGGIAATIISGYLLKKRTDARLPYVDSFTTVFGIIGTWIMVNYVHENWLYFIAINATSVFMYANRKMYLGALMFVLYFVMSLDGYFNLGLFYR